MILTWHDIIYKEADMIIKNLDKKDIASYKTLMDKVFGGSADLSSYEKYESGPYEIIVAMEKEKVIGAITLYKIELFTFDHYPALELFNLGVDSDYRGQGIAEKIFDYVLAYAKEKGYRSISVNCGANAHAAHKLYEKMGFSQGGSVRFNRAVE